jgi:hypothetical protein
MASAWAETKDGECHSLDDELMSSQKSQDVQSISFLPQNANDFNYLLNFDL